MIFSRAFKDKATTGAISLEMTKAIKLVLANLSPKQKCNQIAHVDGNCQITALELAVLLKDADLVKEVLKDLDTLPIVEVIKTKCQESKRFDRFTALHFAVHNGDVKVVMALFEPFVKDLEEGHMHCIQAIFDCLNMKFTGNPLAYLKFKKDTYTKFFVTANMYLEYDDKTVMTMAKKIDAKTKSKDSAEIVEYLESVQKKAMIARDRYLKKPIFENLKNKNATDTVITFN